MQAAFLAAKTLPFHQYHLKERMYHVKAKLDIFSF
jgi:hypothetical protein